jgi:hypothetical protein
MGISTKTHIIIVEDETCTVGWVAAFIIFAFAYWGSFFDDNKEPVYGDTFHLPVNCRAYVQASVDGFRRGEFEANAVMNGLERNCGANGNA